MKTPIFKPCLYLLFLLLGFGSIAFAQSNSSVQYNIEHFPIEKHPLGNKVYSLFQDSQGFIWFNSEQGLFRYDGYSFEKIELDWDVTSHQVLDLGISALTEDKFGNIWGHCKESLFQYNPDSGKLSRFQKNLGSVNSLLGDEFGSIWISSDMGLNRLDAIASDSSLQFKHFYNRATRSFYNLIDSLQGDTLASIIEVKDDQLLSKRFELKKKTETLIFGLGENLSDFPSLGEGDKGWLTNEKGDTVFFMSYENSLQAGGDYRNQIQIEGLTLPAGIYTLHFQSDDGHSFDNWNGYPPDYPKYWGIQIFKTERAQISRIENILKTTEARSFPGEVPTKLLQDSNLGNIYVASTNGLFQIKENGKEAASFKAIARFDDQEDIDYSIKDMVTGKDGMIWIYAHVTHPDQRFEELIDLFDPSQSSFYNRLRRPCTEKDINSNVKLEYDPFTEILWIGIMTYTNRFSGLLSWESPYTGVPKNVHFRDGKAFNGYLGFPVYAMDLDHSGKLWVSSRSGLYKVHPNSRNIQFYALPTTDKTLPNIWITSFGEDPNAKVWISTYGDGFFGFDLISQTFDHVYTPNLIENPNRYYDGYNSFFDARGNIYILGKKGMHLFDPVNKSFSAYPELGNLWILKENPDGSIWTLSYNSISDQSINQFDPQTKNFLWDEFRKTDFAKFYCQKIDNEGMLWNSEGPNGLFKIFPDSVVNGLVYKEKLHAESVWDFLIDPNGLIWAAIPSKGLALIDPKKGLIKRIREKDGLKSDNLRSIFQDKKGKLWLHSARGVNIYDPQSGLIYTPNELEEIGAVDFNRGSGFQHSSGHLFLRTHRSGGFYVFHPDSIKVNQVAPKVVLTGFQLANKEVVIGEDSPLKYHISTNPDINLRYFQNNLSFEYRGLHYDKPEANQYAYQLEGLEEDWVFVGNEKTARYPKLSPGSYVFKVKAANPDGIWSEATSLSITIRPPWFWNWWSKILYVFLALGGLYYWIRSLQKRVVEKELQLAKEKAFNTELQELNEANQRFVPQDFLQILGKESIKDLHLGDQTQTKMTILFSDIRSYTSLSETMSPEDNFKFINGYLGRVGPIIKKHGGFIGQYFGDGFMALFLDNHQAAIDTAIEIQSILEDYNQQRRIRGRQTISTGIGLNTGELMLGIIGDENRYDSTVISDAVNTASRMEGLTKIFGSAIIISEKTLKEFSASNFAHRYLGKVRVKGKDEAVKIYDLYEGESVAIRQLKTRTQNAFEKGLTHYYQKEFGKAAEQFKSVLQINAQDRAAKYYLDKAVGYIVNDVPEDWRGVEEMVIK